MGPAAAIICRDNTMTVEDLVRAHDVKIMWASSVAVGWYPGLCPENKRKQQHHIILLIRTSIDIRTVETP